MKRRDMLQDGRTFSLSQPMGEGRGGQPRSDEAYPPVRSVTMAKTVVFDLGKVLVDFDYGIAARKIAARGRIAASEVQEFIDHSRLLFRYETGEIGRQEFFREVCVATGFCGGLDEFGAFF